MNVRAGAGGGVSGMGDSGVGFSLAVVCCLTVVCRGGPREGRLGSGSRCPCVGGVGGVRGGMYMSAY